MRLRLEDDLESGVGHGRDEAGGRLHEEFVRGRGLDLEGDGTRGAQGGEAHVSAAFSVEREVYADLLLGDLNEFLH